MWSCWPALDWTSQISYEAVASVVRELNGFVFICAKYNAPLASFNGDSDDDRYDIVGFGAAGHWTSQILTAQVFVGRIGVATTS